jgi:hypothetical protein
LNGDISALVVVYADMTTEIMSNPSVAQGYHCCRTV